MQKRDAFSAYHPLVNFLYFGLVLVFSMCILHPVCLGISLLAALCYCISLKGRRSLRASLRYLLPMLLLTAIINPAFNHEGATILAYLPSGNPLTLESIFYGLAAATMLIAVLLWFSCYTEVITSDKFVYLFGRVIPSLSLVLSMILRFVPKFSAQLRQVRAAQRAIGRDLSDGKLRQRLHSATTILSVMVTWSLENAIHTADSMKSRGYGLPGRTAFSIFRFDDRDKLMLIWLLFCGLYITAGWIGGGFYWKFFPMIRCAKLTPLTVSFQLTYLALCLTPLILNCVEDRTWRKLKSEI